MIWVECTHHLHLLCGKLPAAMTTANIPNGSHLYSLLSLGRQIQSYERSLLSGNHLVLMTCAIHSNEGSSINIAIAMATVTT